MENTKKWIARELVSGHWEVVDDETGDAIARVPAGSKDGKNAHLITAAPDLYAAIEKALPVLRMLKAKYTIRDLEAALARARGEDQGGAS